MELNAILDFIGKDSPVNALNFAKKLEEKVNNLPHFPYKCRRSIKANDENVRDLILTDISSLIVSIPKRTG